MKAIRIPSLILAGILQVLPVTRLAVIWQQPVSPSWAIILRWAGSAAAALGGIQAVSGASTVITNPLTAKGTNGIPFKQFRLTTAPDQAHYWTATGLPPGVTLSGKSGQTFWALGGTPTATGVFPVRLTARDQSNSGSDRTVSATLTITIMGTGTPPAVSAPSSLARHAGQNAAFSVNATGSAPLSYQWFHGFTAITGATGSTLTLNGIDRASSGEYSVQVSNSAGSIRSAPATLTVNVLQILSCTKTDSSTVITWNGISGETYSFHTIANLGEAWTPLGASSPVEVDGIMSVTFPKNSTSGHFFRVSAHP